MKTNSLSVPSVTEKPAASPRVTRLQDRLAFHPPCDVCFERALWMTRSYKNTEGEPSVLRQAKAFFEVLAHQTTVIQTEELLIGNITSHPRVPYFAPEVFPSWKNYQPGQACVMENSRWVSSTKITYQIPDEVGAYWKDRPIGSPVGHYVPNYEKVLRLGYSGILKEVEARRSQTRPDDRDKLDFYEAAAISCRAAIRFADRHAAHALALAQRETDPQRRAELETLGRICAKVPAEPAETFHEALQAFWFTHVMIHICSHDWSVSPGRFDQYLFPYYDRDLRDGRLTREEAAELLGCLWIKFNEVRMDVDFINYQNLMLGGVNRQGQDVTNDLSYLCLEVTDQIRMIQPSLSLRVHEGTPSALLEKAAVLVKTGTGLPAFFGDAMNIAALQTEGVSLEDARDYAIAGCEETAIQGKTFGVLRAGIFSQPQCLLFALFNGRHPGSDQPVAPETGDATRFTSFEQLMAAYRTQLRAETLKAMDLSCQRDQMAREHTPYPFISLLFIGCVESGKDITAGGAIHNLTSVAEAGTITAADSLYAIRQAVFENKVCTMEQLLQALRDNFKGHEPLRQYLMKKAPKFGNDNDAVDSFAALVADMNYEVIQELDRRDARGGRFATGSGIATAFSHGQRVGATPDGRRAKEHFSVSLGPSHGSDVLGPTATLSSVRKINFAHQAGGALTHLRLNPRMLTGATGTHNLAALISTFLGNGGMGLHLTVIGRDTLEAAQREPDKYRNLVVRIGGYSAYYVLLSEQFQNELIRRTEH